MRWLAASVLAATASCFAAEGGADPSFLLTATGKDIAAYFPTYLANGYLLTLTSPRGTEPNLSYLVAFMDYAAQDIARPAAIPGWSGINYSTGPSTAGQFWLNDVKMSPKAFADYSQTLNMRDATLTTRYRYTDASARSTRIEVVSFVSQASPHLGVSRISLTPEFTGTVQLSFPLLLWAPHQPRFPIRTMTGEEMQEAVAANNMTVLEPVNSSTPDRAPVWYHGDTHVLTRNISQDDWTVLLEGKAEQGLAMAEAEAIAMPADAAPSDVKEIDTRYRADLLFSIHVEKGRTYRFTKYVAVSRAGWGAQSEGRQMLQLATAARQDGFEKLLSEHRAAWNELWKSDILIEGNPQAQQAIHSDLYYLFSNTTVGTAWPMGACSLTPNYAGHAFWDSDSWVFPALLLLHPERAKPIVMFRHRTLQPARERARQYGVSGTMYPWEADPETGVDYTPHFAYGVYREIHVNADIAIAQWQYYLASGDSEWLRQIGWPVIREIAEFWVSRVEYNALEHRYEIRHVTSPDEAYDDVPNDSFTNAAAAKALEIATRAAQVVGESPDPKWSVIARHMYIPFSTEQQRHLDFDASVPHDKVTWMGSSLSWLAYPNLDLPMSEQVRRNDFEFQLHELKVHGDDPNEMMMVMLAVHAAELGEGNVAGQWIDRNLVGFLKPPFNVRSETADNNAGYILATSAGFLQSFLYGITGLRIDERGLSEVYRPVLPDSWKSLTLKNVEFRGHHYDIVVSRDASGKVRLTRTAL